VARSVAGGKVLVPASPQSDRMKISKISWSTFDLVGGKTTPLKNMSLSVGMIIPNVMFQNTNQ